jgi:osmoprotectant transport system permease protein
LINGTNEADVPAPSIAHRLWRATLEHLYLVVVSLTAAIVVAVPLGVIAAKRRRSEQLILITAEVIQTIPGLALLVMLMYPIGELGNLMESVGLPRLRTIGPAPAIVALFLYSLLPILRNTHAGITGIPGNLREAAEAIGLSPWAQLWQVELPMASRLILAGIKTTAVINVGYATLGGLIGAGGYGQLIMEGLRKLDFGIMMEGAIPSALMALAVKSLFEVGERFVVPRGLRLKGAH